MAALFLSLVLGQELYAGSDSLLFPRFSTVVLDPQPPGSYLFSTDGWLVILDEYGRPRYYRHIDGGARTFQYQLHGEYTYFDVQAQAFLCLDSLLRPHDTLSMPGVSTDFHSLRILPDGRVMMLGYALRKVDMSLWVEGGDRNATVVDAVLWVADRQGNSLFEWNSSDHLSINDADTALVDLRASVIDYVHANHFDLAPDGNYLLTSRNLSEVTKIDAATGEIIWRMGGKNNEFTGDGLDFRALHSAIARARGTLWLFDNGLITRKTSYVRCYHLAEEQKKAVNLKNFTYPGGLFVPVMGNVEIMPDDRLLVGWGKNDEGIILSVHDTTGRMTMEVRSLPEEMLWSYRVSFAPERPDWLFFRDDTLRFDMVLPEDTLWQEICLINRTGRDLVAEDAFVSGSTAFLVSRVPQDTLAPEDSLEFRIGYAGGKVDRQEALLLLATRNRDTTTGQEWFLAPLRLEGEPSPAAIEHTTHTPDLPRISPNPVTNGFLVHECANVLWMKVLDAAGRIIHIQKEPSENSFIATEEWPSGIYFVTFRLRDGTVHTVKLIRR